MQTINMLVNGQQQCVEARSSLTLLDCLRDLLGLRGAKKCCGVGECGACTVLVDGQTVNACIMWAIEADGKAVQTIEGLASDGEINDLQQAFLDCGAVQCGFCIPGMVMSAQALLNENSRPDNTEVREALSGNLCRCGGYNRMFEAVQHVALLQAGGKPEPQEPTDDRPAVGDVNAAIGSSVNRRGGRERVSGEQQFVGDVQLEGMLHVKLVSLNVARAQIESIDASAALKVPGVIKVVTAEDLPKPMPRFGPVYKDRPILAVDETKYHGEPVAAVVAESLAIAELGASLVEVAYRALPAVSSVKAALDANSPLVQTSEVATGDPLQSTNVLKEQHFGWGDVDTASADLVIENNYTFPMVTHFAIEPHGFVVSASRDSVTIWSAVQHPFLLQKMIAELFRLSLNNVRVLSPDPGGGFGGKQNPKFEPLLVHLSMQTGRPCRLVLSLEETFQAVRRASTEITVRSGFSTQGRLVFQDIKANFLIGAYVDIGERVMTKACYLGCGPYMTPNARILGRAILSHTTPSCAFRGFGVPQVNWAVESQMDAAARQLGLDGLAIRLANLAEKGDEFLKNDVPADGEWSQSVALAAAAMDWSKPAPPGRGRGIAVGVKAGATTGLSNSTVRLLADGSVIVYAGTSDMGQGARTIFAQMAADAFGVSVGKVDIVMGDTAVVPFDLQTSASRSTVFMGTAILRACEDIHRQLCELAVEQRGVCASDVKVVDGYMHFADASMSIIDFIRVDLRQLQGELIGTGRMSKPMMPDHPLGGAPAFFEFNCTAIEVEVDAGTGAILIHKHVTVGDVGKAINPLQVEMQDEGGAIMGLGHSMMEHLILDDEGCIRNLGALDYRIPTTKDMPIELTTLSVENGDGPGPYGAKGVSEGTLLCTAPALAAAVADATGAVIKELPLTPERVWQSLSANKGE